MCCVDLCAVLVVSWPLVSTGYTQAASKPMLAARSVEWLAGWMAARGGRQVSVSVSPSQPHILSHSRSVQF